MIVISKEGGKVQSLLLLKMKLGVIEQKRKKKKSPNGHVDFAYSRKPVEGDTHTHRS